MAVERDGLLAAKEAKYREIREVELDHRTGKLSDEDFRAQDRARRAEAIEILRALDELGDEDGPGAPRAPGDAGDEGGPSAPRATGNAGDDDVPGSRDA